METGEQFLFFKTLKTKPELYESTYWNNRRILCPVGVYATERHIKEYLYQLNNLKRRGSYELLVLRINTNNFTSTEQKNKNSNPN